MPRDRFVPRASRTGRPGLVDPVAVDAAGVVGPTRGEARGRGWRRTGQGLFVPSAVERTVDQRIVEAACLLPSYGGITGWAALRWSGGSWFDGLAPDGVTERPVTIAAVGCAVRRQTGVQICAERLAPTDLLEHDSVNVTSAVRSTVFEMRYAPTLWLAVATADMAMFSDLCSTAELVSYIDTHPGWTGIPKARKAVGLTDENAWSPQEVRLRLVWVLEAGFPPPLCNVPIFDRSGRHLGTPDLFDPVAGVVGEYDGPLHLEGFRRARDVRREDGFRSVGLEYFTVLGPDWHTPGLIVDRMVQARRRAQHAGPQDRLWTLEKPPWWIPTETVEQRRQLSAWQRARLLRRRAA